MNEREGWDDRDRERKGKIQHQAGYYREMRADQVWKR